MIDFLSWIGAIGGVGAVFAVLMFFIYRHDRGQSEERLRSDRKFMEDRLTGVLDSYNEATRENTRVNSELYAYLKARNGNKG